MIAFDSAEDRTQACTVGVVVDPFTIHGTPTLSAESTVYRLSLDKLPLLRQTDLTPLLKETLSQYGKVLHVGLYLDPTTQLFFGKGYALIDISGAGENTFKPLVHELDLGHRRLIYASWRGMEKHCFYCHKPGHTKSDCPRLQQQRVKTCYHCGSVEHLVRDCPKRGSVSVGDKRPRYDNVDLPVRTASSSSRAHNASVPTGPQVASALASAVVEREATPRNASTPETSPASNTTQIVDKENESDEGESDEGESDGTYYPDDEDFEESNEDTGDEAMSTDSDEIRDLQSDAQQDDASEPTTDQNTSQNESTSTPDVLPTSTPERRL